MEAAACNFQAQTGNTLLDEGDAANDSWHFRRGCLFVCKIYYVERTCVAYGYSAVKCAFPSIYQSTFQGKTGTQPLIKVVYSVRVSGVTICI